MPSFAKINNGQLYLSNQRFGEGQMKALRDYLVYCAKPEHKFEEVGRTQRLSEAII